MTVKKSKENEDSLQIVKWGIGTNGFRLVLLFLVLSMHPLGRGFLAGFGFRFPDQQKIEQAVVASEAFYHDVNDLKDSVKDIHKDMSGLKANYAILNAKFDSFEQTFTGFRVDFQKYRKPEDKP